MPSTVSAPTHALRSRASIVRLFPWIGLAIVVIAAAAALYWTAPQWLPAVTQADPTVKADAPTSSESAAPTVVTLSAAKLKAAGIEIGKVQEQAFAGVRVVPGKVEYHHSQHLELKCPAPAVVQKVLVEPGQKLAAGDKLAILTSNEIGLARDEVLAHEAELQISKNELAFHAEVAKNVHELLAVLEESKAIASLEEQFRGRRLGSYRESVFGSYSKLKLAEATLTGSSGLDGQGIISGRVREERQSAREVAAAAFNSACEHARFHAQQEHDRAAAALAHQDRLLRISQQKLAALLGPFAQQAVASDLSDLSEFTLCAPMEATVDERFVAAAERVTAGQPLFTLADTRQLWISAEIHERDWKLAQIRSGQTLEITSPALPGKTFTATVHHLGATVSDVTRSVPLVAQLDNPDGQFKPGMFVWVSIAHDAAERRLVVPADAVARHDSLAMVFVPGSERSFRRVNVQTGVESPEWIEIVSGLSEGQAIVTQGAFYLKSELLLEREE